MRVQDIDSMYKLWFRSTIPEAVRKSMTDYIFTQAEIGELFSTQDLDIIHAKLSKNEILHDS
jgi:hypothetical protein